MPHHHEDKEPETETETKEFRRERNGKRAMWGTWAAIATVMVAAPIAFGWVGDVYRITQTPARLEAIEKRQAAVEQAQVEIKESLARIEGALHIAKSPKQKDQEP